MIHTGVGSWSLPWAVGFMKNPLTYPKIGGIELIDFAVSNHFKLVQLYNNLDLLALETQELKTIRLHADANDIRLEIGGMGIEHETIQDFLAVAEILGSRTIRTIILPQKGKSLSVKSVIDIVRGYIGEFEKADRILLFENHEGYTAGEFRTIIESVGSNALGICFDPANSIGKLEHFRDNFKVLSDFIFNCHYKEYSVNRVETNLGFIVEGCCPGEGENIAYEFFGLIETLDQDVDVVLEQWVPYQGSVEKTLQIEGKWAETGMQILKSYWA
jgi:hypothetical protein